MEAEEGGVYEVWGIWGAYCVWGARQRERSCESTKGESGQHKLAHNALSSLSLNHHLHIASYYPLLLIPSSPILISHIASYYPHNSTLPRIDCSKDLLIVDFFAFTLTSSAPVTWSLRDTFQICHIASRLVLPPKLRYVFQDSFTLSEIQDFTESQNILISTTLHTGAYFTRLSYKLVQCSHHFKTILIPTIFWVRDTTVLVVWKL